MGLWAEDLYKNRLKSTWKLAFFSAFFIGLLVHMFKLANVLPYWDSLMNHYSSQDMVASGRWFLSVACSLSSHFDLPWLNGILSLLLLGITAAVIAEHFGMESPVLIILSSGLLVSFPAVTATFAYSYTADGYMVAMLLAALAATLSRVEDIRPDRWKRLLLSSLLLCLSCGIYQAYVSFAFMLAVGRAILELLEGKYRPKDFLRWLAVQALIFGAAPDWGALVVGLISTAPMYWAVGIIETSTFVPMLGAGGSYLSFVTGNISNLKLPCAINALEQNEVSASSEEGEVISTIAIATSSIITTIIIVIGVICIVPLTPILEAPVLAPAFAQMLPALFGGLGVALISKSWKIAIAPIALMLVLFIFVPALNAGTVGIMVPVSVVFTIAVSRVLYKKGVLV